MNLIVLDNDDKDFIVIYRHLQSIKVDEKGSLIGIFENSSRLIALNNELFTFRFIFIDNDNFEHYFGGYIHG